MAESIQTINQLLLRSQLSQKVRVFGAATLLVHLKDSKASLVFGVVRRLEVLDFLCTMFVHSFAKDIFLSERHTARSTSSQILIMPIKYSFEENKAEADKEENMKMTKEEHGTCLVHFLL